MLLAGLDLLLRDPALFFRVFPLLLPMVVLALGVGITVHEASHALMAHRLGDPTARRAGRLTLNPLKHLDPLGTVMLLVAGFGWGRPVPVNPFYLRRGRRDMALVALGGPVSNVLTAVAVGLFIRAGLLEWHSPFAFDFRFTGGMDFLSDLAGFVVFYNLILAVFNLIPLAPLDGSRVVIGLAPEDVVPYLLPLERYGPGILITVILIDFATGLGIIGRVIVPLVRFLQAVAVGV